MTMLLRMALWMTRCSYSGLHATSWGGLVSGVVLVTIFPVHPRPGRVDISELGCVTGAALLRCLGCCIQERSGKRLDVGATNSFDHHIQRRY